MTDPKPSFDPKTLFQLPWSVRAALRRGLKGKVDAQHEAGRLLGQSQTRAAPAPKQPGLSLLSCRLSQSNSSSDRGKR